MIRTSWLALLAPALAAPVAVACGEHRPPAPAADTFFPVELAANGYVQVRDCRAPGEHSALGGFSVWVDPASVDAFDALWAGERTTMPDGAAVVKVTHFGPDCASDDIAGYLAMKKTAGFAPDAGNWHWQELDDRGELVVDGRDDGCASCHEGVASCAGYGTMAGLDYLCTEP